jgi:hypothetical protein
MVELDQNGPDQKVVEPLVHDFDKFFPLTIDLVTNFEKRSGFDEKIKQAREATSKKNYD